jgi:putative YhdH/YhfP family quinone oxidoreductase
MSDSTFSCYLTSRDDSGGVNRALTVKSLDELPAGDVLIRVGWTSVNYKDGLAATGHPGVAKKLPHVPGIDASGVVVESSSSDVSPGDKVIVTGYELGAGRWGGWSEFIRVPSEWVVPLPSGMTLNSAMAYGTAGFTAALCVLEIQHRGIKPDDGEVIVTGATGGVGCVAVQLLAKLGYSVVASTGKSDRGDWLTELGASRVISRHDAVDESPRPLLRGKWAGAVDTVGGATLVSILRSAKLHGCITACGLVGSDQLPSLTVYPFILRGVALVGVTSAECPRQRRLDTWQRLASDWSLEKLDSVTTVIGMNDVDTCVDQILRGEVSGRRVVKVQELR